MSIAIQLDHADGEIAKRFFEAITLEYWQTSKPWIERRRAEKHNPRLFNELQTLAEMWS
jgi:Domain of unknown function (DUF4760)